MISAIEIIRTKKGSKRKCDEEMLKELKLLKPKDLRERIDRRLVQGFIEAKHKMGWGIKWTDELADELHKPIRRKFQRRKVVSKNVDDIWAADLVEMIPHAHVNKGFKYLLTVIDIFSKYGWIIPLKSKHAPVVSNAIKHLFKTSGRKPTRIWTDDGKEFHAKVTKDMLKKNNVILYSTHNVEIKSAVVERWNRTMKQKIWKYFTANNNTRKYIDILPALVAKYNNTYHRSIKCTPTEALDPKNYVHVFEALYGNTYKLNKKPKFRVGDRVRISRWKGIFEKGYTANWSDEVFTIREVKKTKPPTYILQDDKADELHGSFYEPEMQKSTTTSFRIEKVLKRRTLQDGKKQEYVKWKVYDRSYNSWIDIADTIE